MNKQKTCRSLVQRLGACTTSDLANILETAQAIGDDHMVGVACSMICSLRQDQAVERIFYERPLDALSSSKNAVAGDVLLHIAQHAHNARIKVEAIRRLGGVGTNAAKQLLHQLAKAGLPAAQGFANDVIQPDAVRLATFEALSKLTNPDRSDGKAVLDALGQDLAEGNDRGVFRAGAGALAHVTRASQLKDLIAAATGCRHPLMALRLLAACSDLDKKALAAEKEAIAGCLIGNMHALREEAELVEKLGELAKKITHKEFLLKLSDSFHGDCLGRGRGKVSSAALEAYPATDETLTEAYLKYAQSPENVQPGSKCIAGLGACVAAGHATNIAKRIVHQGSSGYQQLLRSAGLRIVFADVPGVVRALCEAIDAIETEGQRSPAAKGVCDGLVRVSMTRDKNTPWFDRLENIREPSRRRGGEDRLPGLAEGLCTLSRENDALAEFSAWLCAGNQSPGTVSIVTVFLKPFDELAEVFLGRLLTATSTLKMPDPPEDSPLVPIEPLMFPDCRKWFARELSGWIVKDGRLNRYAIDLARRHGLSFVDAADKALQQVEASSDAEFILKLLAIQADAGTLRLLARAVRDVFRVVKDAVSVRRTAMALLGNVASQCRQDLNPALVQELLCVIHGCFRGDTKAMRLCAYAACGTFADPSSIVPLRDRLKSETDSNGKDAIAVALSSIRSALLAIKPSRQSQPEVTGAWLCNVADLGDHAMAATVKEFLEPPRPEPVFVAALNCLGKIGTQATIATIDRFVEDTSPGGDVLKAARLAKAGLQGRKDISFIEALGAVFGPESHVLDLAIHYEKLFGISRLNAMTAMLTGAMEQWAAHHWGDFVERIDGFCDLLSQDLYENRSGQLGLTQEKAEKYLSGPYGSGRIRNDEFKNALPTVQPLFVSIHSMRGLAEGAHPLQSDGTLRPGVSEPQGKLTMDQFKELFAGFVQWLTASGSVRGTT